LHKNASSEKHSTLYHGHNLLFVKGLETDQNS